MSPFQEIQCRLRDADMRLNAHDDRIQRRLAFTSVRQLGHNLGRYHGEKRLVDIGADIRVPEVRLQVCGCVA